MDNIQMPAIKIVETIVENWD
uniref:Uncharacterized protein n=1 Tax=Tetranychus urticae TaxID=32264 RepID=T1KDG6_TETUR